MKKKFTKDNIITILTIVALAFFIVGQFSPVSYYINSEYASQTDPNWDNEAEFKEYHYTLFMYTYVRDSAFASLGVEPYEAEEVSFFYLFPIVLSQSGQPSGKYNLSSFTTSPGISQEKVLIGYIAAIICLIVVLISFYFAIKFFKNIYKDSRYPLFLGISYLVVIIMIYLSSVILLTGYNPERGKYIHLGYGFYYQLVFVFILFLIYFIQIISKFLKEKKEVTE